MPLRAATLALPILTTFTATIPAFAQDDETVRAIWDYFAETCSAAVEAENPATFVARLEGSAGAAGQSADQALSVAMIQLDGPQVNLPHAMIHAMVNVFEGGRSVQCSLQLPRPEIDLSGLAEIARGQASDLLGGDVVFAGGSLAEIRMEDGMAADIGDQATYLRASRGGFPPDAVLMVQVMPVFASLTLTVSQAN